MTVQRHRAGTHREQFWFSTRRSSHGWMARAACLGSDPDLFFPTRKRWLESEVAEAMSICQECPVRRQCLDLALAMETQYGLWGGLNPLERSRVKRRAGQENERRARAGRR